MTGGVRRPKGVSAWREAKAGAWGTVRGAEVFVISQFHPSPDSSLHLVFSLLHLNRLTLTALWTARGRS